MIDFALNFYNNYIIIFYILLVVAVILEWPITILILSLLSPKFWLSFLFVFFFSFLWEFFWDLLHYFIWRFFKKNIFKDKNYKLLENIEKKIEKRSLLDKLIVIKYTPPITSIWLIYMWFQKINLKKFTKDIVLINIFKMG
jgi:membrane protein DedA with SNARE-associated domain